MAVQKEGSKRKHGTLLEQRSQHTYHRLICRLPIVSTANEWRSESGCRRDEIHTYLSYAVIKNLQADKNRKLIVFFAVLEQPLLKNITSSSVRG
jgi:hypothetical protein